jgi:hypothetical protein
VKINTPIVSKRRTDSRGQSLRFKISKLEKKSPLPCRQAGFQWECDGMASRKGNVKSAHYIRACLGYLILRSDHFWIEILAFAVMPTNDFYLPKNILWDYSPLTRGVRLDLRAGKGDVFCKQLQESWHKRGMSSTN